MRLPCTIALVGLLLTTNTTFGDNADTPPKPIQAANRTYAEAIEVAKKAYDRAISRAHTAYLAALEKALTQETKAGHLDTALVIRDIRNAAKESGPPVIQKVLAKPAARLRNASAQVKAIAFEPVILKESNDKNGWQRIPDVFKRRRTVIYTGTGKDNGVADFDVIKDGIIFLACNFDYQGNSSGNWVNTRWTKEQFIENGWTKVPPKQLGGVLVSAGGKEQVIFKKQVKRGENYRLRCNKYEPPYVIVLD